MTPELWTKAFEQVPGLCVLAFIVFVFLKHLKSYNALIREINRENITAREQSRIVIEDNTKAVAQNTEVLHTFSETMALLKMQSNHPKS